MIPGVPDVLADAIEKVVYSERLETMSIEQDIVSEQSSFFHPAKGRCDVAMQFNMGRKGAVKKLTIGLPERNCFLRFGRT